MFTSHGTNPQGKLKTNAQLKRNKSLQSERLLIPGFDWENWNIWKTARKQQKVNLLYKCFKATGFLLGARTLFSGQFSFFPRRRKSGSCLSAYLPSFFPGSVSVSKFSVLLNSLIVKILAILYTHPLFGAESVFVSLCHNNQHKKIANIVCEPSTHTHTHRTQEKWSTSRVGD